MPCTRECEYDDELVGFYFLGVFFIALLPRLLRTSRTVRYSAYVERLRAAPGILLFTILWALMYTLEALAVVVVRIDGGHYRADGNRIALFEFWILQALVASYFLLYFDWGWLFMGLFPLLFAIVLAFIVATFFFAVSDVAGVLMYVFASSLVALLVLSAAVTLHNSDRAVVRAAMSINGDIKGRRAQAQRV
jgi:tryptophan-rich sensory protein